MGGEGNFEINLNILENNFKLQGYKYSKIISI